MKKRTKPLLFLILLVLFSGTSYLQAQESLNTSGGNASGSGGTVSFTMGQLAYFTFEGGGGTVMQGVQQSYEISVVSGIEEFDNIELTCIVYPNPATEFVVLSVENYGGTELSYQIFSISGILIENKEVTAVKTRISLSDLIPATYILKVIDHHMEIKTFKIIKK